LGLNADQPDRGSAGGDATGSRLPSRAALGLILVVAAALRGWDLGGGGVITPYYFAGVRSMLVSWHNFLFNAFDPAGFLSLDKPPVAFWLQTASAKLFRLRHGKRAAAANGRGGRFGRSSVLAGAPPLRGRRRPARGAVSGDDPGQHRRRPLQ
jgi:hypothetical protein